MIHELLIHLSNHTEGFDEESTLDELQEFLHPGERQLLRNILEIGKQFHWIVNFCETVRNVKQNETTPDYNITPGFYIKQFGNGIHLVLEDYRSEIIRLEGTFLKNPQLSLTFILSRMEGYKILFEGLISIIKTFQRDNIHGCLIVGHLQKFVNYKVNVLHDAAERITQLVNVVFYQHLCNWIIFGDLLDVYNEFFICDGKCSDEDFLYPDQIGELSKNSVSLLELSKSGRQKFPLPVRKFYINWNMVPSFLKADTAEIILFMGRIVWIVRNGPRRAENRIDCPDYNRDIWEGHEIEYYKKVQALENQSFDMVQFKGVIEECRIKLTKYLWSVMLEEGNLKEQLQLIRDYYGLGRGELFTQFITVAKKHIKNRTADDNSHKFNFIFQEIARKIYGENDKSYQRFELTIKKSDDPRSSVWSRVQLNFEINWPLHIVFHPKSMELYNKLFCYLLRLNKTQINLHKLWRLHAASKQKIDRRVWTLRQHLTFLVNNLKYYLQVDVIEAQFSILLKAVENANEFEDIIKLHHQFISDLLAKTFVLTPDEEYLSENKHKLYLMPAVKFNEPSKVYIIIIRLLDLCDGFCLLASTWGPELKEPELQDLQTLQSKADIIVESLLYILYSLHTKSEGQHLLQLLYQLDFNKFFSRGKPGFNFNSDLEIV